MKNLLVVCLLVIINACNNAEETYPASKDTAAPVTQDSVNLVDSTATKVDTAVMVDTAGSRNPPNDLQKKYGVLGYSYFKAMRQNETRNINAYVSIVNAANRVIDTLKEVNSDVVAKRKNDTASIFTQNLILYKYADVTLIDADSNFIIRQIHENSRQKIDSLSGNFWTWAITPKTNNTTATLILKVIAEKPDGSREAFQVKNIPITINLDPGIFRSVYSWLYQNPEKLLVLILIPLVAFFWKQIMALFRKKEKTG